MKARFEGICSRRVIILFMIIGLASVSTNFCFTYAQDETFTVNPAAPGILIVNSRHNGVEGNRPPGATFTVQERISTFSWENVPGYVDSNKFGEPISPGFGQFKVIYNDVPGHYLADKTNDMVIEQDKTVVVEGHWIQNDHAVVYVSGSTDTGPEPPPYAGVTLQCLTHHRRHPNFPDTVPISSIPKPLLIPKPEQDAAPDQCELIRFYFRQSRGWWNPGYEHVSLYKYTSVASVHGVYTTPAGPGSITAQSTIDGVPCAPPNAQFEIMESGSSYFSHWTDLNPDGSGVVFDNLPVDEQYDINFRIMPENPFYEVSRIRFIGLGDDPADYHKTVTAEFQDISGQINVVVDPAASTTFLLALTQCSSMPPQWHAGAHLIISASL